MSRKPTLCKQSAAVVAHLKQHGAATLDELLPHFADEGRSKLRKRLSNLVDGNWLDIAWDARGAMLWLVAPRARTALPTLPQATPSVSTAVDIRSIVFSLQIEHWLAKAGW